MEESPMKKLDRICVNKIKEGNEGITGMNPNASFGNRFASSLRGIKPSAVSRQRRDSTYQFRYATLSELEFQQ
jgi:hypothetical protein